MQTLSLDAVRGLMIAAQGLQTDSQPPATRDSVRAMIRQMQVLQIDSISVIARSPYLVLWSRLGDYDPAWLDELLAQGALFEYWSHAACFLPIEDYVLYRPINWQGGRARKWLDEHPDLAAAILAHVRDNGETRSADFKRNDDQKSGWFNWKEEKIALEYLFYERELMIRKRHNFQRVYDLRERVYPEADTLPAVSLEEAHEQFILKTLLALSVTKADWIADYFRLKKTDTRAALNRLMDQERVMQVDVDGWDAPGYVHPDNLQQVEAAAMGDIPRSKTTFLSPFDPLVWDRDRARELFDFDYKIEVYTPAAKRKYGYYTLPILHDNALIGRLDPKAHRKDGVFEVKAVHLEPGVTVDDALRRALKRTLKDCAAWHDTPQVIVREATAPGLADYLSD